MTKRLSVEKKKLVLLATVAVVCVVFLVVAEWAGRRPPAALRALGHQPFAAPAGAGRELLGTMPPDWQLTDWHQSEPLSLAALRGRVVLVRWWTGPASPHCAASAAALNDFWHLYRNRGLVVVGVYHAPAGQPADRVVRDQLARDHRFAFPIATDPDWATLRQWWLAGHDQRWSTVTFLLDRTGAIRFIHPGGAYYRGESGHNTLEHWLEILL